MAGRTRWVSDAGDGVPPGARGGAVFCARAGASAIRRGAVLGAQWRGVRDGFGRRGRRPSEARGARSFGARGARVRSEGAVFCALRRGSDAAGPPADALGDEDDGEEQEGDDAEVGFGHGDEFASGGVELVAEGVSDRVTELIIELDEGAGRNRYKGIDAAAGAEVDAIGAAEDAGDAGPVGDRENVGAPGRIAGCW